MFLRQWIDMGGFGRLGDELGDGGNLRPAVAPVGWRATGSIDQVHCQRAGKEWGADSRLDSAPRRWVASAAALTRLAPSSPCTTLMRSSILILTFCLASAAVRESML